MLSDENYLYMFFDVFDDTPVTESQSSRPTATFRAYYSDSIEMYFVRNSVITAHFALSPDTGAHDDNTSSVVANAVSMGSRAENSYKIEARFSLDDIGRVNTSLLVAVCDNYGSQPGGRFQFDFVGIRTFETHRGYESLHFVLRLCFK